MKATWEKLEKNLVKFDIEVEAEKFGSAMDQAFRKLVKDANIPGFRKGKAPRAVFERMYGKGSLLQEAADILLQEGYEYALEQSDLEPIDRPEVEIGELEEGKPFTFSIKVQVKPEVKLGQLSGFGITKAEAVVTEEDVNTQVEKLLERGATLEPDASETVANGSHAVIDFEGFLGDEAFEGGKGEDYALEIGSGTFIPGFEEQLVGAKVGETREIKVTFPEDYRAENLAGKEVMFRVAIKDVKKKVLPELTDEYVETISPFKTVQELRSDITNRLTETARRQAEQEFRNQLVEAVVAAAEVEVPAPLVSEAVHTMIHEFEHQLSQQGLTLEQYHQITGKSHDDLHTDFHEPALQRAKTSLVLEAVAKQEQISVTEGEFEAELRQVAALYGKQGEQLVRNPQFRAQIREGLLTQKTVDHLVQLNQAA